MKIEMSRQTVAIIAAYFILTAGIIFVMLRAGPWSSQHEDILQEEPGPGRAELVINALAAAYPWRVERAEFRDDDWALLMSGVWYYYAGGRLLPEELLEQADEYSGSFGIYNYQRELPPWTDPSPEQAERYRNRGRGGSRNNNSGSGDTSDQPRIQRRRSYYFHEALWQADSRAESSRQMETVNFFRHSLMVHTDIVEVLSLVEERILAAAEIDPQVRSWITGIGEVHGWSWRNVAGSQSRSYHSYGIAVDILPKSLEGKETYWQWAAQRGREWWNIPYEDRYHPPDAVIQAFEAYGFIWGGKWPLFDTMHFEYRPEVFILSGLGLETVPR